MLTVGEFLRKYLGRGIDFDQHHGFQCVDLFRQYCKEVLGVPQPKAVNGASEFWYQDLKDFDKRNKNLAEPGDVIIWNKTSSNEYGHIAVVLDKSIPDNKVLVVEQNGFTQEGTILKVRSLNNVLGILKPRRNLDSSNKASVKYFLSNLGDYYQRVVKAEGWNTQNSFVFNDSDNFIANSNDIFQDEMPGSDDLRQLQQAQIDVAGSVLKVALGMVAYKYIKNKELAGV